jgi:hypothetical protein
MAIKWLPRQHAQQVLNIYTPTAKKKEPPCAQQAKRK